MLKGKRVRVVLTLSLFHLGRLLLGFWGCCGRIEDKQAREREGEREVNNIARDWYSKLLSPAGSFSFMLCCFSIPPGENA